jgi:hypothetical protein
MQQHRLLASNPSCTHVLVGGQIVPLYEVRKGEEARIKVMWDRTQRKWVRPS